jgi:hypothetical protein
MLHSIASGIVVMTIHDTHAIHSLSDLNTFCDWAYTTVD